MVLTQSAALSSASSAAVSRSHTEYLREALCVSPSDVLVAYKAGGKSKREGDGRGGGRDVVHEEAQMRKWRVRVAKHVLQVVVMISHSGSFALPPFVQTKTEFTPRSAPRPTEEIQSTHFGPASSAHRVGTSSWETPVWSSGRRSQEEEEQA